MRNTLPERRSRYVRCRLPLVLALLLPLIAGCGRQAPPASTGKLRVVTTMSILQDMINRVGGDRVEVQNIIPMGAGPESYQPKPQDAAAIAAADIVFYNGTGLEDWLQDLFESAGGTAQPRIGLSDGLPAIGASAEFSAGNPHFWLDPQYGIKYVERIRDALSTLDPEHAATYRANAQAYIAELRALDSRLAEQANKIPLSQRKFVTNHDAFPYFARRYGFRIVDTILPSAEAQLSAAHVRQLVEKIRAENVRVIFAESQFRPEIARQLAEDAAIAVVATLYTDTLGPDAPTYAAMLEYNMQQIVSALTSAP